MRSFKLVDQSAVEFDLMRTDAFFHSPDGLGFGNNITYVNVGNNFISTETKPKQKSVTGEMVFKGYTEYTEFKAYIAGKTLKLAYKPLLTWYYLDVDVVSLGKTEISGHRLTCPISFAGKSKWYTTATIATSQPSTAIGKTYSYTYPYTYSDASVNSVLINNATSLASPLKIHIMGACTNPHWTLIQNGVVLASGEVTIVIPAGNKLVIDSNADVMEIAEYTISNVLVADRYDNSDFSTARFISAPIGISTLGISHDGAEDISMTVEVAQLEDTV